MKNYILIYFYKSCTYLCKIDYLIEVYSTHISTRFLFNLFQDNRDFVLVYHSTPNLQ